MKDLSIIDDTKITKADKDGAAVIIDVDNYVNEANWQLNNKEFYKEIPNDLTQSNRKKVNHPIKELKSARILDEKNDKVESSNYMFPKKHKPEKPGRLVMNSVNCHTTSITQYVDHHLQPHAKDLKSYIKNSTDFIKKI